MKKPKSCQPTEVPEPRPCEPRFRPPTLDQVAAYCRERENHIDPRAFVDYYQACGWKVGSKKMRDWRAAVRTWEYRDTNEIRRQHDATRHILLDHAAWEAWKELPDSAEKYQAYLCSPEWGRLRALVAERSGGTCERCRVNPAAAVHHLTYRRKYHEDLEDLIHECEGCHRYSHGLSDQDPITEYLRIVKQVPLQLACCSAEALWIDPATQLLCPVCRDAGFHFATPAVTEQEISIPCRCEAGHRWDFVLQTHQGLGLAFCRNLQTEEPPCR